MKNNRQLLSQGMDNAMEDYFSFDSGDVYAGGNQDWNNAGGWNNGGGIEGQVYAGGGANAQGFGRPTSTPFIVTLSNTSVTPVTNVTFLDAIAGIKAGAVNQGVTAGISVTYGISGVDYAEFLYSLTLQSVMIGMSYVQSATSTQLLETIEIATKNVRGQAFQDIMNPVINPFQQQSTVITMDNKFILNGFTKLTIAQIAGETSVKFFLYPMKQESSVANLQQNAENFNAPQLTGVKSIQ